MAKLTNNEVLSIKKRLLAGEDCKAIAQDYPEVGWYAIRCILTGQAWKHVGPDVTGMYNPRRYVAVDDLEGIVQSIYSGETIISLGERMGHDPSTIARTFKRETGMSIRQFKKAGAA